MEYKRLLRQEKATRIAVGATVGGVLLVLFLIVVLIIQFVQIGVQNRMEDELNEQISRYEQMIADGEDKITYYEEGNGLYYLARKHGWQ